uniref:Poly [ADP-ribose] polymerase n=1 Tax=Kalanchoe fedtschenkoi TaxID=63787 RepID=A0A7N0UUX5_KALFE
MLAMWNHASCILKKAKQIKSVDDVDGIDMLRWEDQQKIRKYIEGGGSAQDGGGSSSAANKETVTEFSVEVSQNARSSCKKCGEKITKGEVRISTKPEGKSSRGLAWHHASCLLDMFPTTEVEKLPGWDSLEETEQETLRGLVDNKTKAKPETPHDQEHLKKAATKKGEKRKTSENGDQKSKVVKTEGDVSSTGKETQEAVDMEAKLEAQAKTLWALKDDLKNNVSASELRQMLGANGQSSSGSELDLRERCADGMLFGALPLCPLCSGHLSYTGGMYRCHGYLSEWGKCSYSTAELERLKGKWKIPEESKNVYLCKWFKTQKGTKPSRILPTPSVHSLSQVGKCSPYMLNSGNIQDLKVSLAGLPDDVVEQWTKRIKEAGGTIHSNIKKDTDCLVVGATMDHKDAEMKKARRLKVPIVREEYLVECFKRQKKLSCDPYKVEAVGEASSMVTVKVKGMSAVHEASGLQEYGHILEDGKSIYNTTLNMSDLSTGVNSYYILQIIQQDKGSECHVFRKWGRVGNEKIGGKKMDPMPKADAISEFKRLFLEKTGNEWEAWEQKQDFMKKPGRFFPLDIDYGVNKQVGKIKQDNSKSQLATPLFELMSMLFNVETYKAAMLEFEINMSEMPLGKLSKRNIQNGFEALTEIQNLLNNNAYDASIKESLLVNASNRFFTLIPSIHPHIIRDEDDFQSKVKMLEALQDIEIASRLVGFDVESDESLDEKYKKLRCDISPLPHDSEDYKLIEKYLQNTHAPTHTEWSLQLEEVFALEREGESDQFASYRDNLKNKMLLWHGSRLTNFVGILSQGLRIAPPEAPATGYMFGKGVYFADLVSKSAQYCFTDRKNPVGLMLLSEVALGEIYELKKATYMDKPPKGKHSTKGLGQKKPQESEYLKWKDDVVVPCGKPVPSNVRATELMYNEYIVYNTSQVKMQFLLKVKFHHKR